MLIIFLQMGKQVLVIAVLVLLVLGVGGWFFLNANKQTAETAPQRTVTPSTESSSLAPSDQSSTDSSQSGVKEFTVTGESFKFTPNTLSVNKGDKVKVTFKNAGGMHNFVIDELNVKSKVLQGGQEEVIEFTADKSGTFEFYCSVGNHRAMGMKGTLEVK